MTSPTTKNPAVVPRNDFQVGEMESKTSPSIEKMPEDSAMGETNNCDQRRRG